MAEVIEMPKMSDTMTEGVIAAWNVKVGDKIKSGDVLAEVQTDKATMDLESFFDGVVLYIGVNVGDAVPIGKIIAIIGKEGEDIAPYLAKEKNGGLATVPQNQPTNVPIADANINLAPQPMIEEDRIKASPLAKAMAKEKGLDLEKITGTGDGGRIVKKDVLDFEPKSVEIQPVQTTTSISTSSISTSTYEEINVSQMRKTIARRLSESKFSAPHFYLTMSINMDKAIEIRGQLNQESQTKISFNDLIVKACAVALRKNPMVNVSWLGDKIRVHKEINIGVAVAVEEGLIVPVIRNVEAKGLEEIAQTTKELATKAKNKQLQPNDWAGNTFTISNLGMFGIEEFTAIINPPDACILAVGGISEQPIVKNGNIVVGNIMKVTLSCDHRVVDGAVGSAFLQTLKYLLENPLRLIL